MIFVCLGASGSEIACYAGVMGIRMYVASRVEK